MRSATSTQTLKLATARLEFRSDRRFRQVLHLIAVAAFVFLAVTIGRRLHHDTQASGAELADIKRQNATLRADLERARTELDLERSTRAALARQVAELNEDATELKSRLDFFNDQTGRRVSSR
jgi:septal ring factor EnvC (AmiA/AmiB activator)